MPAVPLAFIGKPSAMQRIVMRRGLRGPCLRESILFLFFQPFPNSVKRAGFNAKETVRRASAAFIGVALG